MVNEQQPIKNVPGGAVFLSFVLIEQINMKLYKIFSLKCKAFDTYAVHFIHIHVMV